MVKGQWLLGYLPTWKDWEYSPDEDIIYMPKGEYNTFFDSDFMAFVRELGLFTDFDCITLSLLHELGHAETCIDFDELEWGACSVLKMDLYEKSDNMPFSEYISKYWNIPDELAAQKWLVVFANGYQKECQDLENIFAEYTE